MHDCHIHLSNLTVLDIDPCHNVRLEAVFLDFHDLDSQTVTFDRRGFAVPGNGFEHPEYQPGKSVVSLAREREADRLFDVFKRGDPPDSPRIPIDRFNLRQFQWGRVVVLQVAYELLQQIVHRHDPAPSRRTRPGRPRNDSGFFHAPEQDVGSNRFGDELYRADGLFHDRFTVAFIQPEIFRHKRKRHLRRSGKTGGAIAIPVGRPAYFTSKVMRICLNIKPNLF